METNIDDHLNPTRGRRFDWLHIVLLVLVAILVTAGVTYWLIKAYVFPTEFRPVTLNAREEQVLNAKLDRLESLSSEQQPRRGDAGTEAAANSDPLEPEPYSERGANRQIALTEKELNALLARNTDLARRLAIDLSGDLVSAKLLVPVDEDFPVLGGQTVKVRAGVELAYRDGKPVVVLKGVSIMGVPLPNAWMGGIKNIDLVQEYGQREGFWKSFSDGVEYARVEEGKLIIELKE